MRQNVGYLGTEAHLFLPGKATWLPVVVLPETTQTPQAQILVRWCVLAPIASGPAACVWCVAYGSKGKALK